MTPPQNRRFGQLAQRGAVADLWCAKPVVVGAPGETFSERWACELAGLALDARDDAEVTEAGVDLHLGEPGVSQDFAKLLAGVLLTFGP